MVVIIPDTFALTLNHILQCKLGGVDHYLGGVFVELKEIFYGFGVHEIISDNNFLQESLESFFSVLEFLLAHFEEAFAGEGGERMVVFEFFEKGIKLGEPFIDVPLIIVAFELDAEENGTRIGFKIGNGDTDVGCQVVVIHNLFNFIL